MDREYRVDLPASERPAGIYDWRWIAIALGVGVLIGRIAGEPAGALRGLFTGVAVTAFGVLAFTRPLWAVQLFLFAFVGGISGFWQGDAYGTVYTGADLMLGVLFGAWLVSGGAVRSARTRRFSGWIFVLVLVWLSFTLYGVLRGNPWVFVQRDAVPGAYLLAFFPIADVLEDDRSARAVLHAVVAGLLLMACGLLFEYVTHFDAGRGIVSTTWGQVYGEEGVAGGPRVTSFAGQWISPVLLGGLVMMGRREGGARSRAWTFSVTGLAALALLIVYTRSLIASTVFAAILLALLVSREPRRAVSMAGGVLGLVLFLSVVIPLLGGSSMGEAFDRLMDRFSNISQDPSWIDRGHETRAGLEVWGDAPFAGVGFGPVVHVPELEDGRRPPSAYFDNAYAGMLAKTGVVGTGLFVVFCLLLATRAVRIARVPGAGPVLAAAGVWLLGMMLASWSSPFLIEKPGILYVAALAALVAYGETRETERPAGDVAGSALELDEGDPRVPADLWEPAERTGVRGAQRAKRR